MPDKRIATPADGIITIPREALEKLNSAGAEELKLLVFMFGCPDCPLAEAAKRLGITLAAAEKAYSFWLGAGIFKEAENVKKQVARDPSVYRNYDSETISGKLDDDGDFKMVCDYAGNKLGKQLTKNDYSALLYLFDFVGMPAPVICGIIEHCCDEGRTSLQYIFKKTVGLYDEGIDSYDKFEKYLARRAQINSDIGKLRKLCGMGDRELSTKEKAMFDCWFGEWKTPFELVRLAYEKTVDAKGSISFPYMNSILRRWNESGFVSVEDVAKGESSRRGGADQSFDVDEFIAAAMNRKFED